jgi:hypothetical protein
MNEWSSARRGVARHPVLAFMLISLGIGFAAAAVPPIVDSEILPLGRPLHGVFMSLGAGLAAFLVTAALSGRIGVADLRSRSLRWRVPVRWYLIALLSVPVGGDTDLAGDIRSASSGNAVRWLAASSCRGRRNVLATTGVVPAC